MVIQQLTVVSVTCFPEGLPLPVMTPTLIWGGNANGSFETVIFNLWLMCTWKIAVIQQLTLVSVTRFPEGLHLPVTEPTQRCHIAMGVGPARPRFPKGCGVIDSQVRTCILCGDTSEFGHAPGSKDKRFVS